MESNHGGLNATRKMVSTKFYWNSITSDVEQFIKQCPRCRITRMRYVASNNVPWRKGGRYGDIYSVRHDFNSFKFNTLNLLSLLEFSVGSFYQRKIYIMYVLMLNTIFLCMVRYIILHKILPDIDMVINPSFGDLSFTQISRVTGMEAKMIMHFLVGAISLHAIFLFVIKGKSKIRSFCLL